MIISPDDFRTDADGRYDASPEASSYAWTRSYQALLGALQVKQESLVLLVGVPGAGKSTWIKSEPWAGALGPLQTVYFDATLTRRVERQPLIELGQRYKVPVEAVVFLTPLIDCVTRNDQRSSDRKVPFPVIARMHENMRTEPVMLDEGFERIRAIRPEL